MRSDILKNFLKLDESEQKIIILNTANKLKMKPSIIEKDLWVCLILDYLFNKSKYKDYFIFKGGTSLSKGYNVIKRFSEDIDLILDWNYLNYTDEYLFMNRFNNAQNKVNEEVIKKCSLFLQEEFVPSISKELSKILNKQLTIEMDSNDKDLCTVNIYYPNLFESDYSRREIKLEIGPIAGREPAHQVSINTYISMEYKEVFNHTFKVRTIDVERTFWEKIAILNSIAYGYKDGKIPIRYARHYYDVYCIATSPILKSAFNKKELFAKDISFRSKFYYAKNAKYDKAYIGNVKLIPSDESINALKEDYKNMEEMFFNKPPTFEEILDLLKNLQDEINKL